MGPGCLELAGEATAGPHLQRGQQRVLSGRACLLRVCVRIWVMCVFAVSCRPGVASVAYAAGLAPIAALYPCGLRPQAGELTFTPATAADGQHCPFRFSALPEPLGNRVDGFKTFPKRWASRPQGNPAPSSPWPGPQVCPRLCRLQLQGSCPPSCCPPTATPAPPLSSSCQPGPLALLPWL